MQVTGLLPVDRIARRVLRLSLRCAPLALLVAGAAVPAQPLADVQVTEPSQPFATPTAADPHPVTYYWSGEVKAVTRPVTDYYHFYYTGRVNADARVDPDIEIKRIPVPMSEWERHRRWVIAKLTNFYQQASGQEATALADYQRWARGGDDADLFAATPTPTPTPTPDPLTMNPYAPYPGAYYPTPYGPAGMMPGMQQLAAEQLFDAAAAAEWTFYYDQLVLWQYYCARVLLNDTSDSLLESSEEEDQGGRQQGQQGQAGQLAMGPAGVGGIGFGAAAAVPETPLTPQEQSIRQRFNPLEEYEDPEANLLLRQKFIEAANEREEMLFNNYLAMLDEIEQREINRQNYDQWIQQRQAEVQEFGETWRKLREGEILLSDGTLVLITPEPIEKPPLDAINLPRTEQVTPQDLINADGTLRRAEVQ